ncbi:unnamed protein product [Nesidiocoris tenuis]|uniref:Uncharacterized protein n=1 Tax=Nesidiocoris tenuis TaxID=355587 RepID=A0A6H5GFR6_9HEMI|nr:unnamed protein product [Nesidiocoris tenuis]
MLREVRALMKPMASMVPLKWDTYCQCQRESQFDGRCHLILGTSCPNYQERSLTKGLLENSSKVMARGNERWEFLGFIQFTIQTYREEHKSALKIFNRRTQKQYNLDWFFVCLTCFTKIRDCRFGMNKWVIFLKSKWPVSPMDSAATFPILSMIIQVMEP